MSEKFQLKRGICKVNWGFHSKLEGYTTLKSDIPKLYAKCARKISSPSLSRKIR